MKSVRVIAGALALTVAGSLALGGCGGDDHPAHARTHRPHPSATGTPTTELSVGLYGTPAEIAAYTRAVDNYDAAQPTVRITVETWPDAAAMLRDLNAGKPAPDVFLAARGDLDVLEKDKTIAPVDELLAARNVDLGDAYSREALEAFSADRHLTCMPYAATPQVVYYNTDVVDFDAMKAAALPVPSNLDSGRWTIPTFAAAVQWAARPALGMRAFSLPSTVEGLTPYLYSGKGKVVDDENAPTSLAFSDPSNQSTWDQLLPVLRGHGAMLSRKQLRQHSPLQWFERGKLGMLVGDRSLVPELRARTGLHWDVMSLPSVAGTTTIGDYTGLCLSAHAKRPQAAADLLAYLVSRPAVSLVAQSGYVVPVNTEVAMSTDFLQPTQQPAHAKVFVNNTRSMHILPIPSATLATLDGQVGGLIGQLLTPDTDVAGTTAQIDATSRPILQALQASLSPSPSASGSPSAGTSPSAGAGTQPSSTPNSTPSS